MKTKKGYKLKKWTDEEDNIIRCHYPTRGPKYVSQVTGRGYSSTKRRAHDLGVSMEDKAKHDVRVSMDLKHSPVTKQKIGNSIREMWADGSLKISDEGKARLAVSRSNRRHSAASRAKMSQKKRGIPRPEKATEGKKTMTKLMASLSALSAITQLQESV